MDTDRRQRLEALSFWNVGRGRYTGRLRAFDERWETGFSHLKEFAERYGHGRVPRNYKTDEGYGLGEWVQKQRKTKDKMDSDHRQRLEAASFWLWKIRK